jgi:hypothetical protein
LPAFFAALEELPMSAAIKNAPALDYWQIAQAALFDTHLPSSAFRLLTHILADMSKGQEWPGMRAMARRMRRHPGKVHNALGWLEQAGYVTIELRAPQPAKVTINLFRIVNGEGM